MSKVMAVRAAATPFVMIGAAALALLAIVHANARLPAREAHEPVARASGHVRVLAGPDRAEAIRVIDGDTFEARLRIWFNQDVTVLVRLDGVDAPEMRGRCERERRLAIESRDALAAILHAGPVSVRDLRTDKYNGRAVARATVALPDGTADDIGRMLEAGGYARIYDGRARSPWCGSAGLLAEGGRAR